MGAQLNSKCVSENKNRTFIFQHHNVSVSVHAKTTTFRHNTETLCVRTLVVNCSCLTLSSDLLLWHQHTILYMYVSLFVCVSVCICTVMFVCQPIWQYLLSLLRGLVHPCCLKSGAALWSPLTIKPEMTGDYKGSETTVEVFPQILLLFFSLKEWGSKRQQSGLGKELPVWSMSNQLLLKQI